MHVGMSGHGASGEAQVIYGFVEFAEFFESATEIVAGNAVERIDLHGVEERVAGVSQLAQLVIGDSQIDVRFDPIGRELDDTLVILNGLRQRVMLRLTIQRRAKKILGCGPSHGVKLGRLSRHIEREAPLLQKRIERNFLAGRDDVDFAAQIDEAKLVQRQGRRAKLLLYQSDRAFYLASGDVILNETLQRAKSHEIHEAIKTLTPACFRADQA